MSNLITKCVLTEAQTTHTGRTLGISTLQRWQKNLLLVGGISTWASAIMETIDPTDQIDL